MKLAVVILVAAFAVVVSGNRSILQVPAPAPAPGPQSCPAPQEPGENCAQQAALFQTSCVDVISALTKKTGGEATAETDSEIRALVASLGVTPSAECCTNAQKLLRDACLCNSAVQALAQAQQKLSPSDLILVGKTFAVACDFPTCTDTCRLSSTTG